MLELAAASAGTLTEAVSLAAVAVLASSHG